MQQKPFVLYGSEGCHLCELALALCEELIAEQQLTVVDIVDEEHLVAQYGVHIPVLKRTQDNKELYWPFNQEDVYEFYQYGTN